jgi:hypothetical protein
MREKAKTVALCAASILVGAGLCELWLRVFVPPRVYTWTRDILQQEISAPSATAGYVNRANARVRFKNREFDTRVAINSRSLRDKEYDYARHGRNRIVVLGDSFSFGWGVEQEDCVTEILEQRYLRNTDVINMSVPGYNTRQEVDLYREEGTRYDPQLVAVFWFQNDDASDWREMGFYFRDGRLYLSRYDGQELSAADRMLKSWMRRSYLFCFLEIEWSRWREAKVEHAEERRDAAVKAGRREHRKWTRLERLLGELKHDLDARGAKLLLVNIPESGDYRRNVELGTLAAHLGAEFLDLAPRFQELPPGDQEELYYTLDRHWTPKGHRTAALFLADHLRQNGLLAPSAFR